MHSKVIKDFKNKYSFPLDDFQIKAIKALLDGQSVLVTAPTGSGKTVIAEFTVFDSLDRNLRAIYTTPLKALSNQKFRDLCDQYGPAYVGLLTGDTSINPEAPILVMTTEILRNILYQDISRLDHVLYVVLDECHYMNDRERGTVWEEILIHCPRHILFVALSATIANAKELAAWITSIHNTIVVIEHPVRPVPIEHLYYTNEKLFPLLHSSGEPNFKLARSTSRDSFDGRKRRVEVFPVAVLHKLHEKNLLPAIYFVFSRRGCDTNLSDCLHAKFNLVTKEERAEIQEMVNKVKRDNPSLSDTSPITKKLLHALPEGIAVHHAGLVPVLRHLVEMLFQKNLIKVVFATETLAAGINMPARTTVISTLSKRGDFGHEVLSVNSFRQMTGRAGRRGKDEVGFCVIINDGREPYSEAVRLVKSPPDPIQSNFTLSYNMVLNLLKNFNWKDITNILRRSFGQYLSNKEIIDLRLELEEQQKSIEKSMIPCEFKPQLKAEEMPLLEYENIKQNILKQESFIRREQDQFEEKQSQKMLNELSDAKKGTVLIIKTNEDVPILASLVVKYRDKGNYYGKNTLNVIVLTNKGVTRITPAECLYVSQSIKMTMIPDHILAEAYNVKIGKWLRDKKLNHKVFDNSDNKKYMIKAPKPSLPRIMQSELDKLDNLRKQLSKHECQVCPILNEHLHSHKKFKYITNEMAEIKSSIEHQSELYISEFKRLMNVLKHYEQIHEDSSGEFKPTKIGLITSYIRSENELAISLMIDKGILDSLKPVEIAAVLSTLIYEPRKSNQVTLEGVPKIIKEKIREFNKVISELMHIQDIEGVEKDINVEVDIVQLVWMWGNGCAWRSLFQNNQLDDGDVIRSMRRIIDLLHQLKNIPDINLDLQHKVTEAIMLLDRDLITVNIEEEEEDEKETIDDTEESN
jgi:superfamily II RNA helicase